MVSLTVKVPSGMIEADLARPVIEIRYFDSVNLVNEIYTYGEQTIVMELKPLPMKKTPVQKIAEREILREVKKQFQGHVLKLK